MRRARAWLWASILFAGSSFADMPDAASLVRDVDEGRVDVATFDFAAAGFWDLDEDARTAWTWALLSALDGPSKYLAGILTPRVIDQTASCHPDARRHFYISAWSAIATRAAGASEWRTLHGRLLAQREELDRELDSAVAAVKASGLAPNVAELMRRFARDQAVHQAMDAARHPSWPAQNEVIEGALLMRSRQLDIECDNSRWLKEQLAVIDWFDARRFGADADRAAGRLLSHSGRDHSFKVATVDRLLQLPRESTSQRQLAYLVDEVAYPGVRPQRFGTRRTCMADKSSEIWPELEDPAGVNQRRASMGLAPVELGPRARDPGCAHAEEAPPPL